MRLRHFIASNDGGIEFLSVCDEHVADLGEICQESPDAKPPYAHKTCDLCEMNSRPFSHRLADLLAKGILK